MVASGCKRLQVVASGKISCLHPFATTCNHLQPPEPLRTKCSKSISDSDMLISDSNSGLLDGCKRLQVVASGKISCLHPFATTCNHYNHLNHSELNIASQFQIQIS